MQCGTDRLKFISFRFIFYVIILIIPLFHNNIVIFYLEKIRKKNLQNEKLLLTSLIGE